MDDREPLRQRFNREFADRGIELPVDAISLGVVWLIVLDTDRHQPSAGELLHETEPRMEGNSAPMDMPPISDHRG